jgi:hypothetical protein
MADESLPLPTSDASVPPPSPPDDSGSLADHEATFHGRHEAKTEAVTPPAESPEPESPEPSADGEGERDEKGRFVKKRHRAQSQEATPQDVPRIRELTARLRAAEAERDALKARTSPPPPAARVEPPPAASAPTPKPTPEQFQDYSEYIDALTDWKTEQFWTKKETERQQQEQQRQFDAEQQRIRTTWTQRVNDAKQEIPDFEEVALLSDTAIPQGSLTDAWILESPAGPNLLYRLQKEPSALHSVLQLPGQAQAEALALFSVLHKSPEELRTLLALPLFDPQSVTLLAQRLNGTSSRQPAAGTGSAAPPPSPPAPRPPNPVRTGPIRGGDEPPDDEKSSLADHERYYQPRRRRG